MGVNCQVYSIGRIVAGLLFGTFVLVVCYHTAIHWLPIDYKQAGVLACHKQFFVRHSALFAI